MNTPPIPHRPRSITPTIHRHLRVSTPPLHLRPPPPGPGTRFRPPIAARTRLRLRLPTPSPRSWLRPPIADPRAGLRVPIPDPRTGLLPIPGHRTRIRPSTPSARPRLRQPKPTAPARRSTPCTHPLLPLITALDRHLFTARRDLVPAKPVLPPAHPAPSTAHLAPSTTTPALFPAKPALLPTTPAPRTAVPHTFPLPRLPDSPRRLRQGRPRRHQVVDQHDQASAQQPPATRNHRQRPGEVVHPLPGVEPRLVGHTPSLPQDGHHPRRHPRPPQLPRRRKRDAPGRIMPPSPNSPPRGRHGNEQHGHSGPPAPKGGIRPRPTPAPLPRPQ